MVEYLVPIVDISNTNIIIVTLELFFVAAIIEIGGGYLV
jgi:hypothetical protein